MSEVLMMCEVLARVNRFATLGEDEWRTGIPARILP